MRSEANGLHNLADGAGGDEQARFFRRAVFEPLRIAHREDTLRLRLDAADLGQLVERDHARLVDHYVLAGAHDLDRRCGPDVGRDRTYDQLNRCIFENFSIVGDPPYLRKGLHIGSSQIILCRVHSNQFGACIEHGLGLAVNMAVVEADGCKFQVTFHRSLHRFIPDMATPSMMRRWKNRNTRKIGRIASTDMANSWPQAEVPVASTNERSASGTV